MITIDGSSGEGGGQILRTSLALSLVTGKPFCIERIRAGRDNPGLQRQHLTAVRAAAEVGQAKVDGAVLKSRHLGFVPGNVRPGEYHFDVGTAGSVTLVLQTVLPALMLAEAPSQLVLEGGTHNIYAPPFDFLQKTFLPLVARLGPRVEATLGRAGFYPAGGGQMTVRIEPRPGTGPLALIERGPIVRRAVRAVLARLPRHVAEREIATALAALDWPEECATIEQVGSAGPGNALMVEVESREVCEVFTGFGQRGVPAETVAAGAAREAMRYLGADVPVGPHLADQLLLPMALLGGGRFRTLALMPHTVTNIATLEQFLDLRVGVQELARDVWEVTIAR
jgi:RNA 3'-terminal phosphate cyclase (ATP)